MPQGFWVDAMFEQYYEWLMGLPFFKNYWKLKANPIRRLD